jgi:hypothetical protein
MVALDGFPTRDSIREIRNLREDLLESRDRLHRQLIQIEQLMSEFGDNNNKSRFDELKGNLFVELEELERFEEEVLRRYEDLIIKYLDL